MNDKDFVVAGLDLAANPKKCSGYASMSLNRMSITKVKCLYEDDEIIRELLKDGARLVAIDAPLSPKPVFRSVDRKAIKMGYRVLPPTLGGMRMLVERAWKLYERLIDKSIKVIETHPRSALKSSGMEDVKEILEKFNVKLNVNANLLSIKDLRDAVISLIVAYCYYVKKYLMEIKNHDGTIYLISSLSKV